MCDASENWFITEVYSQPCKISMMELFAKYLTEKNLLPIFAQVPSMMLHRVLNTPIG